jgi:hypothetical protein
MGISADMIADSWMTQCFRTSQRVLFKGQRKCERVNNQERRDFWVGDLMVHFSSNTGVVSFLHKVGGFGWGLEGAEAVCSVSVASLGREA